MIGLGDAFEGFLEGRVGQPGGEPGEALDGELAARQNAAFWRGDAHLNFDPN